MQKKGNKKVDVEREVDILKKLTHPAILSINDYIECDKEYVLITELWVTVMWLGCTCKKHMLSAPKMYSDMHAHMHT